MYSLSVKAGWNGTISGLDGLGWIVLQPALPGVPSQVLQVAPFPLMILTLLLVNIGNAEWVERTLARLPAPVRRGIAKALRALRATLPPCERWWLECVSELARRIGTRNAHTGALLYA